MQKNNSFAVDEILPPGKLFVLGIQHVLVMYAGAVVVPLIIGRALKLPPHQVAFLISADLFCCGLVSILQSLGLTSWVGIKLPVMMGVSFAAVGPMLSLITNNPQTETIQLLFGSIIGAGLVGLFLAPLVGRLLRFFPPVVTGSIILVIGITLMRIGIQWIFGNPFGPTAPKLVHPDHAKWLQTMMEGNGGANVPPNLTLQATEKNPLYASTQNILIASSVLVVILLILRFAKGFFSNLSVLCGILFGGLLTALLGVMHFENVEKADWFSFVLPFHFGAPIFSFVPILTLSLVMLVIMIESLGMFLALGEITGAKVDSSQIVKGLRADAVGTLLGGIFNTFPYTSFSQNVGLVGVTGISSRFVCVMGGAILLVLGLLPKLSALVEAIPTAVLGGSGLIMFGMVVATGVKILSSVDFQKNRHNAFVVALSVGFGMIPLVAPDYKQWMPSSLYPLIESGIVLTSVVAVLMNIFFGGAKPVSRAEIKKAAAMAGEH